MVTLKGDLSPKSLQRSVGLLSASACIVFASLNAATLLVRGTSAYFVLLQPAVFLILVMGLAFYLSGVVRHWTMQALQVVAYLIGGVMTSVDATVGDLTSTLFAIYGLYLFNEYGEPGKRLLPSIVLIVGYLSITTILADIPATPYSVINHLVFAAAVVGLYSLVVMRQIEIRRRYANQLESEVQNRTKELEIKANQLSQTLEQRNALIQEIHHRIGNSLQLLASYIGLQSHDVDSVSGQVLKETELRIHAISDVHARLYATHEFSHLPLNDYSVELLYDLEGAYATEVTIQKHIQSHLDAHIDFAIPFGIILNELVTNAIKHSSRSGVRAEIAVTVQDIEYGVEATVQDSGQGFPAQVDGVGSEVVDQLVLQLAGSIERHNDGGAQVRMRFPAESITKTHSHTNRFSR